MSLKTGLLHFYFASRDHCVCLLFPMNQRGQLKYGALAMLHEQCLVVHSTIQLSLKMFTWEVYISLSQMSKRSLASHPAVIAGRDWESYIPGWDSSPVWQLWKPVARNLQFRAEFQKGMDWPWILSARGSYHWHVLIIQEMLAVKGGSRQGDTKNGFLENFLFYLTQRSVGQPEVMGRGQLYPLATLIPLITAALMSRHNKTTNNRRLEYPTYRCLPYCVAISILYSSEHYCFSSWSISSCGFSPVCNRVSLIKTTVTMSLWECVLSLPYSPLSYRLDSFLS